MSVFDGSRVPDGVLMAGGGATGPAVNTVNVTRGYALLEVQVLVQGGTPSGTFFLIRRGELLAGSQRVADCGQMGPVTDASWPATGLVVVVAAAGVAGATFRVRYPRGEYSVYCTAIGASANWTASYSLAGEAR